VFVFDSDDGCVQEVYGSVHQVVAQNVFVLHLLFCVLMHSIYFQGMKQTAVALKYLC